MSNTADLKQTLSERGERYGDFTDHSRLCQQLQNAMREFELPIRAPEGVKDAFRIPWNSLSDDKKQALTVIADKIARILSGDPEYTDNWHDIQGYAKLAEDRCKVAAQ